MRSSPDAGVCLRSSFLTRALFSALALVAMAPMAFPQVFTVTIEGPKLQQSSLLSNPSGRVVLTNSGSTGFEQDNHTIATSYIDIVGTAVDTLPALTVGFNAGSNQMLGVNGGSPSGASLSVAGTTTVGDAGGGNLAVTDAGVLDCGADMVGNQPGSSGTVTVNGAGGLTPKKWTR